MHKLTTLALIALLTACQATGDYNITSPEGTRWRANGDGSWTNTRGYTTQYDPRIPLCSSITLKREARECVVAR